MSEGAGTFRWATELDWVEVGPLAPPESRKWVGLTSDGDLISISLVRDEGMRVREVARRHRRDGSVSELPPDPRFVGPLERFVVTAEGEVWAGAGDADIFTGDAPLVRRSASGQIVWEWPRRAGYDLTHCYALTLVGDEVWCCYFPDFEILRVDAAGEVSVVEGPGLGEFTEAVAVVAGQPVRLGWREDEEADEEQVLLGDIGRAHLIRDGKWFMADLD